VTDEAGNPVEIVCSHDAASLDPSAPPRKVKGVIHWASPSHGVRLEARSYDRLFTTPEPGTAPEGQDWHDNINPRSLEVSKDAVGEPSLGEAKAGDRFQLERVGFFVVESPKASGALVLNRTLGLRDSWAKEQAKDPA
jgi:glutaminyl-tRNA synthetase